ncbi:MAG: hypothetical protein WC822_05325 [Candidatus Paceibacterota bacterium]|jgi:hypothetical protein
MSQSIVNAGEIFLNSKKYKIKGIRPQYVSRMPGKVNVGSDSYDRENYLSNWSISDQRGGIGIEEMDESVHADRCWWTNCDISQDGHIALPRLATAFTLPTITATNEANLDWETWSDASTPGTWTEDVALTRDGAVQHGGTYCGSLAYAFATWTKVAHQSITWTTQYRSRRFYLRGLGRCSKDHGGGDYGVKFAIYDGVDRTYSGRAADNDANTWVQSTWACHTVNAAATELTIEVYVKDDTTNNNYYFDDMDFIDPTTGTFGKQCNFNSNTYIAHYNNLYKENTSTGTSFDYVYSFPAEIKYLTIGPNNCMYIFLGDTEYYWYMSTAEAFTQTNVTDATRGIPYSNTLIKMDNDNNAWYAATPNSATPSWSAFTTQITDLPAGSVNSLELYSDADGNDIVYLASKGQAKVLDWANKAWLNIKVHLGDHPNGGKGSINWRDGLFFSAGLNVTKYTSGSTATISEVGLNRDGGLPAEYNGEIVKLYGMHTSDLFAMVDNTQSPGKLNTSGIYSYNGRGWVCVWENTQTAKEYQTSYTGFTTLYGTTWAAQTFTASASYTIKSAAIKVYKTGSPGDLTVSIKAVDG